MEAPFDPIAYAKGHEEALKPPREQKECPYDHSKDPVLWQSWALGYGDATDQMWYQDD